MKHFLKSGIWGTIASFFRLKSTQSPEAELGELDQKKITVENTRGQLLIRAAELEVMIASVREKEAVMIRRVRTAEEKEAQSEESASRRAYERVRFAEEEKRSALETERWELFDLLRQTNLELASLQSNLFGFEARAAAIEKKLEAHPRRTAAASSAPEHAPLVPMLLGAPAAVKWHIRVQDLFTLALRTFRVKLGMTMLTILGIGVSFATIFFLVSLGYGMEKLLLSQFASETLLRTLDVASPNPVVIPLDQHAVTRIMALPGIAYVEPVIEDHGQIKSEALATEVVLRGVNPEHFAIAGGSVKEGRVYGVGEHAIILASSFLQTMGKTSLADFTQPFSVIAYQPGPQDTGEATIVNLGDDFHVVGIVEDDENANVFLSPEFIATTTAQYAVLKILAKNVTDVEGLRTAVSNEGFLSSSVADTVEQATKVFRVVEIVLSLFGIAALIVATIGMVNTMTVSLLERTQEIGIMKVLGVADGDVRKLFLLEASIIGGLGGLSGLVMGFTLSEGFNILVNFLAQNLGGKAVTLFYYPVWFVASIVVAASVVGFITGLVPSQRAANMDPLVAVKYK